MYGYCVYGSVLFVVTELCDSSLEAMLRCAEAARLPNTAIEAYQVAHLPNKAVAVYQTAHLPNKAVEPIR